MIRVVVNDSADHLFSRVVEIEAFSCNPATLRCVNNGGTGGCFATIQAAVNASNPGDLINVAAGTYPELVTVNKRLTLRGAQAGVDARTPRAPTTITTNSTGKFGALGGGAKASALRSSPVTQSPPTESVVTGNNGSTSFNLTASDVTIDGFPVHGATNQNQVGAGIVLGAGTAGAHKPNNNIPNNILRPFPTNHTHTCQAVI